MTTRRLGGSFCPSVLSPFLAVWCLVVAEESDYQRELIHNHTLPSLLSYQSQPCSSCQIVVVPGGADVVANAMKRMPTWSKYPQPHGSERVIVFDYFLRLLRHPWHGLTVQSGRAPDSPDDLLLLVVAVGWIMKIGSDG